MTPAPCNAIARVRAVRALLTLLPALLAPACASGRLAVEPPPLATMEEPVGLFSEPDDEQERRALPAGAFTGIYVGDSRSSLAAMGSAPEGVVVTRIVENSPGAAAGVEVGDLLFEVRVGPGEPRALEWPSDWRELELESEPGVPWQLAYDRAGVELEARLAPTARLAPPDRDGVERLREEVRVGVVVRTATEVEARAAGLGPGAGAVVVGLSLDSPWRAAGVRYEDLITAVAGQTVGSPQALVDAIRAAPKGEALELRLVRGGEARTLSAPLTRREGRLEHARFVPLFSFERERDRATTSVLLGLFRLRRTPAAWDVRLLWLISFGGGDADRLVELDR